MIKHIRIVKLKSLVCLLLAVFRYFRVNAESYCELFKRKTNIEIDFDEDDSKQKRVIYFLGFC